MDLLPDSLREFLRERLPNFFLSIKDCWIVEGYLLQFE
jgi:hypothetical protein